jgi:hypothetical protein
MGVRLFDPKLGRFLQADPVPGGSANAYDYANADPCNSSDTTGLIPKCGKKHKTNGYNLQIITSRRGGGVTKDGHRYIGYYVETQIKGFANRYLSRNAVYAETWGTRPGKRRMGKLQGKASWYTPWKKQWEVHYNIQVEPGTPAARHGDRPPARGLDQRTLAHRSRANGRESDGPGWGARRVEAWAGSRGWEEAAPRTVYRTSRGTPPIGDSLGTSRDFQVCPRDIPGTFRRVNREGPDSPEGNERAGQDLPPQHSMMFTARPRAPSPCTSRTCRRLLIMALNCVFVLGWVALSHVGDFSGTFLPRAAYKVSDGV